MKSLMMCFACCFLLSCDLNAPSNTSAQAAYSLLIPQAYTLYPNDVAIGDSTLKYLPDGLEAIVQNHGQYHFKIVGNYSQPAIQIYPLIGTTQISNNGQTITLSQTATNTWEGDWVGDSSANAARCILLTDHGKRATAPQSWSWTGSGSYSQQIGLEIVVFSQAFADSASRDSLINAISAAFTSNYAASGITINPIKIVNASSHPLYGSQWAKGQSFALDLSQWALVVDGQSQPFDDVSAGWTGSDAALVQIALVDSVLGRSNIIGLSPYYGQSAFQGQSSTIELSGYYGRGSSQQRSSIALIAHALTYEFGHFLGLRHTTLMFDARVDSSLVEDDLSDTPFNIGCQVTATTGTAQGAFGMAWTMASTSTACPDDSNLMFPFALPSLTQNTLSPMQNQIMVKNLGLLPH